MFQPRNMCTLFPLVRQHAEYQRGLSGTGHPRHRRKTADRKFRIHILQIVQAGVPYLHPSAVPRPRRPLLRPMPRQPGARDRIRLRCQLFQRAAADNLSAMPARTRPNVDDMVRSAHYIRVMLDHQYSIAVVTQLFQNIDHTLRILRMQAHRRLVQHIKYPRDVRVQRRGQPQALRFTA